MSAAKTEQPTHKKLQDQRKEGQLPQRKYAVEAIVLVFSFGMMSAMSDRFVAASTRLAEAAIRSGPQGLATGLTAVSNPIIELGGLAAAYLAVVFTGTLVCGLLLNGFNVSLKVLKPRSDRVNPINTLKNLFTKKTPYDFARLLTISVSMGWLFYYQLVNRVGGAINGIHCGMSCDAIIVGSVIMNSICIALFVIALLAIIDCKVQNRLFIAQNKMSKDDINREYKESDGDPKVRSRRKTIALQEAEQWSAMRATHVAYDEEHLVAVVYHEHSELRPFVVLRARGASVERLVDKYRAARVPTFNIPGVASDFYAMARIGHYLPPRSAIGIAKIRGAMTQKGY